MTPFRFEAVLLDYGGTLDGDGVHWSHRFDRIFRAGGLDYTDDALQRAFRHSESVLNSDPAVASQSLPTVLGRQVTLMLEHLERGSAALARELSERLVAETRGYLARNSACLEWLRGRSRVGILSNFTGNLELILREEGLLGLVDGVYDSAVVGLRKPDPEFFRHALKQLGASPERAVMVGDSVDMDLRPARALGMTTVWVEGERARETDFAVDARVGSVRELPALWSGTA